MTGLVPLVLMFLLMWLLLVRPQQRRVRQHQQLVSSLRVGDEVVTYGGIYGTVTAVDEEAMSLEIAPGVVVRALRTAVNQRVGPPDEDDAGTGADDRAAGHGGDLPGDDEAGRLPSQPTAEETS